MGFFLNLLDSMIIIVFVGRKIIVEVNKVDRRNKNGGFFINSLIWKSVFVVYIMFVLEFIGDNMSFRII